MLCAASGIGGYRESKYISQWIIHLILSVRVEETTYTNINLKVSIRIQCGDILVVRGIFFFVCVCLF